MRIPDCAKSAIRAEWNGRPELINILKNAAIVLALTATAGSAGNAPWTSATPRGATSAHQQMAAQAAKVNAQVGVNGFGLDPQSIKWQKDGGRNFSFPISNVHASTLKSAITGRYHVYQDPGETLFSVRYYAPNGDVHMCLARGRNKHKEYRNHYMVSHTEVGLSAVVLWGLTKNTPKGNASYGWPMVVDSNTGELAIWAATNGKWKTHLGWVQSEYTPAFAEHCPKLPRVNAVSNQNGDTLQELARGARPVKIQTAFANSSRTPLTAGMYYHFYPPAR